MNKEALEEFLKRWRIPITGGSIVLILLIVGVSFAFCVDREGQKKEKATVKANLKEGVASHKHNPHIKKLPVYVKPKNLSSVWSIPIKLAITSMNATLQASTGRGPFFLEGSKYKGTGTLLTIEPAPKEHHRFREKCQQMHLADNSKVANKTWGFFEPRVPAIYLCMNRLKVAWSPAFQNHPPARALRDYGRENIIRHELGHSFFSAHTTSGCGLMCASPVTGKLSTHELWIIKNAILPQLRFER